MKTFLKSRGRRIGHVALLPFPYEEMFTFMGWDFVIHRTEKYGMPDKRGWDVSLYKYGVLINKEYKTKKEAKNDVINKLRCRGKIWFEKIIKKAVKKKKLKIINE